MTRLREPVRLLSRAPKDSILGLALAAARTREPTASELRSLGESLQTLEASSAQRLGGSAAGPLRLVLGLGAVVVALAVVTSGFRWSRGRARQPMGEQVTTVASTRSGSSGREVPSTPLPGVAPSPPTPSSAASAGTPRAADYERLPQDSRAAHTPPRSEPRSSRGAATPAPAGRGPSELELIDAARQALRSSPAHSLSLLTEHEQRFPRGSMAEEREVIRIAASMGLGQVARAQALGKDFLRANPGSAYARRVKAMLAAPSQAVP
jgi:hypothetical protein